MKAKKGVVIALLVTAVIGIFVAQHFYFSVNGAEISELIKTENTSTIQIVKTYETSEKSEVIKQIVLNDEQKEMLISLLEDTKFKRIISKSVPFSDKERYLITVATSDNKVFFRLESYGGEFIIVDSSPGDSPAKHWKLRIENEDWKNTLEEIIALSN